MRQYDPTPPKTSRPVHHSFFGHFAKAVHSAEHYVGKQAHHQWSELKRTEHLANQQMSAELKAAPHHAQDQGRSGNVWKDWGLAFAHAGKSAYRAVDRPLTHAEKKTGNWLWNGPLDLKGTYTAGGSHGKPVWQQPESGLPFKAPQPGVIEGLLSPFTQLVKKPNSMNAAMAMAMVMPGPKPMRGEGMALTRPELQSRPWYRGDAHAFTADKIDPAKFDPHALFGPGLYLTDNPHVAVEYADKGLGNLQGTEHVRANVPPPGGADLMGMSHLPKSEWNRRVAMMGKKKSKERSALLRQRLEEAISYHRVEGHDVSNLRRAPLEGSAISRQDQKSIYPGLREVAFDWTKPGAGPNVKAFALPGVKNTLHEHTPPNAAQLRALAQAGSSTGLMHDLLSRDLQARQSGQSHHVSHDEVAAAQRDLQDFIHMFSAERGDKGGKYLWGGMKNTLGFDPVQVNELLLASGIQGFQYHGGQRRRAVAGDVGHTAINVFDPKLAVPHTGMGGVPKTGGRAAEVLASYSRAVQRQVPQAQALGTKYGARVVGDYPLDQLFGMAKVQARDLKIRNRDLVDEFVSHFIHAAPFSTKRPFGLSNP